MMSASLVTRDEISQSPTPCSYAKTAEDIKSSAQDFQKLKASREQEVKGFHCDVSDREIEEKMVKAERRSEASSLLSEEKQ